MPEELTLVDNRRLARYLLREVRAGAGSVNGRIAVVLGTRPEFVKMAATVGEMRLPDSPPCTVIFTNQHPDLGPQTAESLGVVVDIALEALPAGRSMTELLGHLVTTLATAVPGDTSLIVVQGDTVSALAASLVSELMDIPLVHVEAGVRSGVKSDPFPEEINRRLISQVAELHLCFTSDAVSCLLAEGHVPQYVRRVRHPLADHVSRVVEPATGGLQRAGLLVTLHRRERRRERLEALPQIVKSVRSALSTIETTLVWHPGLAEPHPGWLDDLAANGCEASEPLPAIEFLHVLASSSCVLTDSAGVAEEAELLGIPLAIFRAAPEHRVDRADIGAQVSTESPQELADFLIAHLRGAAERPKARRRDTNRDALPSIAEEILAYADSI